MSTIRDLVTSSLRLAGITAAGETPAANDLNDGISSFSMMMDMWANEGLLVPNVTREVFALTPGKKIHTFGTGGDFVSSRPLEIQRVCIQDGAMVDVTPAPTPMDPTPTPVFAEADSSFELPVRIINSDEYSEVVNKSSTSTIPSKVYADMAFPLINFYFWPVPSVATNAVIYSKKSLGSFTDPDTILSLPAGYEYAIKYNLALELAIEWGRSLDSRVDSIAASSKGVIQIQNSPTLKMKSDADGLTRVKRTFNIYTGEQ